MSLVEVVGLSQIYGERKILKNVGIEVDKGEVFALIGPTGAGKTTLLRLINLLEVPTSGRIRFDGVDIVRSARIRLGIRRRMAFVLQKPVVFNTTVYNNIAYGLKWRGVERKNITPKVNRILEMVDLLDYKNKNARVLSGGETQRVAIARAMVIEPEVLLLDEPTANLDPISTSNVEELIESIIRQHGTTIIMATHDMSQGQRLADRMGVLINGELHQTGGQTEVFALPRNKEVAKFVGVENILDGVITSNEQGIVDIDIKGSIVEGISDYSVGEEVCACVRPEDIILSLSKAQSSARNMFTGQITRITSFGPLARIEIDCGLKLVALVTRKSAGELNLENGRTIHATFKATGVHVIRRNSD